MFCITFISSSLISLFPNASFTLSLSSLEHNSSVLDIIKGNGEMYEISQAHGEPYKVNDEHILTLHMPDHKTIFWNYSKNGWTMLWWDMENNCTRSKTVRISNTQIICPECNQILSSHLKRHYSRQHKDKTVPKVSRKSPTKTPEETDDTKKAYNEMIEFSKTINDNNTFDISIQDYIKFNDTTKKRLAGVRGKCVEWDKKNVSLDPYVLGLWLGDGAQTGRLFSCYGEVDHEIIDYLTKWGESNDATIIKTRHCTYSITSTNNPRKHNYSPLRKLLAKYDLLEEKHIPKDYLINDRTTRLQVLAGIIDTDGNVSRDGTRVVIAQGMMHKRLVDDIVYLARSLGFSCQTGIKKTSWTHKGIKKTGTAYNINISGNGMEDIPTRLPRKKCASTIDKNTSFSTGSITVKPVGLGDYVGITIDGNERFLINDFTVTHNCTNIYSTDFWVETLDSKNKKLYKQHTSNNMYKIDKPVITDTNKKDKSYTQISFHPDFKRFGIDGLSDDIVSLMKKRAYDIAATTSDNVKVYLDDELLEVKNIEDYMKLFYDPDDEIQFIYETINDRWKVGVVYDPNAGFNHVSYVNGICTFEGGTHIDYVSRQLVDGLSKYIKKEYKDVPVKNSHIKDNITLFLDCTINDPAFKSQIKESLSTKQSEFGSVCEISSDFIKKVAKTGLAESVAEFSKLKAQSELKKIDGKKKVRLSNIEKLDDAHWAGSRKSRECRLILTEGDSAKTFATSGLDVVGRERYGVFPLRGKLLNVREATPKKLMNNEEIKNIIEIMGLKFKTKYNTSKELQKLRYGGIILLVDQDLDGSHIKGLLINFLHCFWPDLLKVDNFIQTMATPIIKIFKKTDTKKLNPAHTFYTLTEYNNWVKHTKNTNLFEIKYYKGLGTSKEKEAKECFTDIDKKLITYIWSTNSKLFQDDDNSEESEIQENKEESPESEVNDECNKAINLAFAKHLANKRKSWLKKYNKDDIIENNVKKIPVHDFVHRDLIHFSNYDNIRSIPSIDGFKPSQRKILYACLLRKLFKTEIKVAQLSGYVSDVAEYHHGEDSLQGAIVGMAQDYTGSNNINLLLPNGNFGTRRQGGKDASSARYIYTQLNELVSYIFRKEDSHILNYIVDDGHKIEPELYYPIIPMILVNGSEGIGTGFSTNIPSFNPLDITNNLLGMLDGKEQYEMTPWYYNFQGEIIKNKDMTYYSYGTFKILDDKRIQITELPIGTWIETYKTFLESLIADDTKNPTKDKLLINYINDCGNNSVNFTIEFLPFMLQKLIKNNEIVKKLKLVSHINLSNMHLYNTDKIIQKFNSVEEIMSCFYNFRLEMYDVRKKYYIKYLTNQMNLAKYRSKFIEMVITKKIIIQKRKKQEVLVDVETHKRQSHSVAKKLKKAITYLLSLYARYQ